MDSSRTDRDAVRSSSWITCGEELQRGRLAGDRCADACHEQHHAHQMEEQERLSQDHDTDVADRWAAAAPYLSASNCGRLLVFVES